MTRNIKERKRKKYTLIIPAKRECYSFLEKGCKIDAAGYAKKKKKTSKWICFAKKSGAGGNEVNILHCMKTYLTVMVKIRFGVSQLLFKQLSGFF